MQKCDNTLSQFIAEKMHAIVTFLAFFAYKLQEITIFKSHFYDFYIEMYAFCDYLKQQFYAIFTAVR